MSTDDLAQAQARYSADGYVHLKEVAPRETAQALLALIQRDMAVPGKMDQLRFQPPILTKAAYEFYSYTHLPLMGFHWGVTSRMCLATGKRLVPTYAYFRLYQGGDICMVHADRQSCEHSLSLPLAYSDGKAWAFEIGKQHRPFPSGPMMEAQNDFGDEPFASVTLEPGDALLYQGPYYRHGRVSPNPNRWSAHVFMHWVDAEGPFADWAFDRCNLPPLSDFALSQ